MFRVSRRNKLFATLSVFTTLSILLPLVARADGSVIELITGTSVLASQSGNTTSTTSSTNIFSPPTYVDIKRRGGEPTVAIDRYPFVPGPFAFGATTTSYKDLSYISAPEGVAFPGYSVFWKSNDSGQTY